MHWILICRSLTTAQKSARLLQKKGIYASVTKAPQNADPKGCAYGVKIAERNLTAAMEILNAAGVHIERTLELPTLSRYGVTE